MNLEEKSIKAKDDFIYRYLEKVDKIVVPRYQRNYAWEKKNIKQLIDDLIRENNYYIGNIIVNDLDNNELELIDGQQRMITIFLIYIALYNQNIIGDISHILKNGQLKIDIENRIDNSGVNVMKSIQDDQLPSSIKKFNEVKRFNDIKKMIKGLEEKELESLVAHLKTAKIVEIKFLNAENLSHEMFVNLNTKGKPLEGIEIIKSHLFKFLIKGNNSDFYKEEWYQMLELIDEKYHGKYLQNVGLFESKSRKKATEKEALNFLLDSIDNIDKAKSIFDKMTNKGEGFPLVFSAVKKHDLLLLKEYIDAGANVSIQMLDNIWKMFGQIKFEQFDIVMVSYLFLPKSNKKRKTYFLDGARYLKFVKCLKLILLYVIYQNIQKVSPSNYANRFESLAIDLFTDNKNIDEWIKKIITDLKIDEIKKEAVITAITGLKCTSAKKDKKNTSRELKLAKIIIQIIDENYIMDLKSEHIIPESVGTSIVYKCGNIIPVINDRYADKEIKKKLDLYKQDEVINASIKKFLEFNPKEDNIEGIVENRTRQIAENYWGIFEELRNECLK